MTYALGSCVSICLYDKMAGVAGLSHIMLPDSTAIKDGHKSSMKFADTAIPMLIDNMKIWCKSKNITAKSRWGINVSTNSQKFNIGERNVISVKKVLHDLKIPIIAQDTGLDYGRTVFFHASTGKLQVKSAVKGIIEI